MRRRGAGEVLMFFPFLFICLIIMAGIVIGVKSFYSGEYDVRQAESDILAQHITDCFDKNDFFSQNFDVFRDCNLNRAVLEKNHAIYIKSSSNPNKLFVAGIGDYVQQCSFVGAQNNPSYPKCVSGTLNKNGESFYYLIGSNQKIVRENSP